MAPTSRHPKPKTQELPASSHFFVESSTPGDVPPPWPRGWSREDSIPIADFASQHGPQADVLDSLDTRPDIAILERRLVWFAFTTTIVVGVFTAVFYAGIVVETVYERPRGHKKAEERVETFNSISGYVMALVEVLVGMHVEKFQPVLEVYVHNALYWLRRGSTGTTPAALRARRALHTAIVLAFPVVLTLLMGNSLRGLQASSSSVGFQYVMQAEDLKREQPMMDAIKAAAQKKSGGRKAPANETVVAGGFKARGIDEIILKNAIRDRTTPFTFLADSPCAADLDGGKDNMAPQAGTTRVTRQVQLNVHELDTTAVVYGFDPQEWNSETLEAELTPSYSYNVTYNQVHIDKAPPPSDFSLTTAFEMFMQGKILIERSYAETTGTTYPCTWTDGRGDLDRPPTTENGTNSTRARRKLGAARRRRWPNRRRRLEEEPETETDSEWSEADGGSDDNGMLDYDPSEDGGQWLFDEDEGIRYCEGAVSSIYDFEQFMDPRTHTLENLMDFVTEGLNTTFRSTFELNETAISFEKYDLSPQIHVEALRIDVHVNTSVDYGLQADCTDEPKDSPCYDMYTYEGLSDSFCGSTGCAFLDKSGTFQLQKEIGIIPYTTNCSFDAHHIRYSSDFRGFYPKDTCKEHDDAALIYGIGTYISGREYGNNDTVFDTHVPYIHQPRRHVRFTFAKMSWTVEDIAEKFGATCKNVKQKDDNADCMGLWYKLSPSGRYLFAGKDALPTKRLAQGSLRSPIPLVQLNTPSLHVALFNRSVTLERLNPAYFHNNVKWTRPPKNATGDTMQCSMLIDSYLRQVEDNNYFLERPLQAMYTSAFFYLMERAGVTAINDTTLALNASTNASLAIASKRQSAADLLGNVKLNGDVQIRDIRVLIPRSSFYTTLGGCVVVVVLLVLILARPARRVEHFDDSVTRAGQFMIMVRDEKYPASVHDKMLLFPETHEIVPMADLVVENVTLVHSRDHNRVVRL